MKPKLYLTIALRIILLMGFGFLMSFVTPTLRGILGDLKLDSPEHGCFGIDAWYAWGARHYWYAWAIFLLFILSLADAIIHVVNAVNKHYPEL